MGVSQKLRTLKTRYVLRSGGLVAHQTSTLAGIAVSAHSNIGISRARRFKRRRGPFLLLADSISTALNQAVFITPALRNLAKQSWPGSVTLVFKAKQVFAAACYKKGMVAIRVDSDVETRRLAKHCGGVLISSSLNRKGGETQRPSQRLRYRWHRHLSGIMIPDQQASGSASRIIKVSSSKTQYLR